jgi:hypothetical protein
MLIEAKSAAALLGDAFNSKDSQLGVLIADRASIGALALRSDQ